MIKANASTRCKTGESLNDVLYVGPKLRNIVDVLHSVRLYWYAFSSDICKIYRQIQGNPKYQYVLWRSPKDTFNENSFNTVTNGVNSAPFFTLLTHDIADNFCSECQHCSQVGTLCSESPRVFVGADSEYVGSSVNHFGVVCMDS